MMRVARPQSPVEETEALLHSAESEGVVRLAKEGCA
jgi:hypothetical protein